MRRTQSNKGRTRRSTVRKVELIDATLRRPRKADGQTAFEFTFEAEDPELIKELPIRCDPIGAEHRVAKLVQLRE